MNITLEEQIEYMRELIATQWIAERNVSQAILATLEACREQKIAFMDAYGNITGYVKVKNPTAGEWEAPLCGQKRKPPIKFK